MKKFLALAVALLGLGMAQAVTVNWTLKLGGTNPNNSAQFGYGPGWVGLCYVADTLDSIDTTDVKTDGTYDYTLSGKLKNASKVLVNDGRYYDKLGADSNGDGLQGKEVTLSFSTTNINTNSITFVLFNIWNTNLTTVDGGYALLTIDGIDTTATELTIDLSDAVFEWTKDEVKKTSVTVPEPTALALLALGVAGVVIRRRRA